MSEPADSRRPTEREAAVVTLQLGRPPREPWRIAARCVFGFPSVIASPSRLADGEPFPNLVWLTCPHLVEELGAKESDGATARWAERATSDAELAQSLRALDAAVRDARALESAGEDACASVGIAGQRDPLGVKCLHAHVALALAGFDDAVGSAELATIDVACADAHCMALMG